MTFEERVRRLLEDRLAELRAQGDRYRVERDRLNGEDAKKFLAEYRGELLTSERTKAREQIRQLREAMAAEKADIEAEIGRVRAGQQPTGAEAIAARVEAADARHRVRELLQRASVSDVLARAEQNRDRTTLEALREEVTWLDLSARTLGDVMAEQLGMDGDDAGAVPVDAVQRRIDQAMLPLLPRALADAVEAELTLAEQWPATEHYARAAEEHIDHPRGLDLEAAITARILQPATADGEPESEAESEGASA